MGNMLFAAALKTGSGFPPGDGEARMKKTAPRDFPGAAVKP